MWSAWRNPTSTRQEDYANSEKERNRRAPVSPERNLHCDNSALVIASLYILKSVQEILAVKWHLDSSRPRNEFRRPRLWSICVLFFLVCTTYANTLAPSYPPPAVVLNGGPGQALMFYGSEAAAVFPLTNTTRCGGPSVTLEFWVAPRCSAPSCTYFTMQYSNISEFAYVHRESVYCFGQRFVLTDGAVLGLSAAPRWDLFNQQEWHHFAMEINGNAGTCSLFVNGTLFVQANVTGNSKSFVPPDRLILGQLVQLGSPSFAQPFQGSIDEIRVWCGPSRYPGLGLTQMNRGLLSSEIGSPSLLSYWSADKDILSNLSALDRSIFDPVSGNIGYFIAISELDTFPRTRFPTATLGPSTAPILTYDGSWVIHINVTSNMQSPFRYICLDGSQVAMPCPALQITINALPTAGQLYALNSSSSQQIALNSGSNMTTYDSYVYQPIPFLLNANAGVDSFRWSVPRSGSALVQILAAPVSAYSTRNQSIGLENPVVEAFNDFRTVIQLGCGSTLGEPSRAVIISAPITGQLFQILPQPSNVNPSIGWNATASVQVIPCEVGYVSSNCIVSHPGGSIIYQPFSSSNSSSLQLSLSYACFSYPTPGYSPIQTVQINWKAQETQSQMPFMPTMVGPNPYALQFDGQWTGMTASMPTPIDISAISMWVQPRLNTVQDTTTSSYLEQQTLLQLFPISGSLVHPFEMILYRNASTYPNFFLVVNHYNLDNSTSIGQITMSTYGDPTYIEPNSWTNILITVSSGAAVLYLDGSPILATTLGTISPPYGVQLGSSGTSPESHFSGMIDEVTLWSKPLGAFDILAMQFEAVNPNSTGLEVYWSLNEGTGSVATDSVKNISLAPVQSTSTRMPLWVPPSGLTFSSIETSATLPQIITLATHSTPSIEKWQFGVYLSQLPTNGALYQLPLNYSSTFNASSISELQPISDVFSAPGLQEPLVRQWASNVRSVSSSRASPVGTNYWDASHILGPPHWWGTENPDEETTSKTPIYGDTGHSWCPRSDCNTTEPEWIEVTFNEALYIRRLEIFQNLRPGAVTKIAAWDQYSKSWRELYQGKPTQPLPVYSTLRPDFCSFTSFTTDTIRIEIDPCEYYGWVEIEAVRMHGTRALPVGVVSHPEGKVLYVPDSVTPGADKISYTASTCPFTLPSASPSFTYQLFVNGANAVPLAYSQSAAVTARAITRLSLIGYSPSATNASIQRVISRLPAQGQLYNAVTNARGQLVPGALLQGTGDIIVDNSDGYVFFSAPSSCMYNMTTFDYYVTSEGVRSSTATITVDSLCPPSFLNYRRWVIIVLFVLLLGAITFAVTFGLYAFVNRKKKQWEADRPPLLILAAVGAFLAFTSLLFELAPVTVRWCLGRTWVLHIGTTLLVVSALAQALLKWHDFAAQALTGGRASHIPPSIIVCLALVMVIEVFQLIVYTTIDRPRVKVSISSDNSAASVAICENLHYSNIYLLINKAVWLVVVIVVSSVLVSVAPAAPSSLVTLISASIFGLICGIAFMVAIGLTHSPIIRVILTVIAVLLPITVFLAFMCFGKFRKAKSAKQTVVETSEFGLQPISPQKASSRQKLATPLSDTNPSVTLGMNIHSADKSVTALMDTVQDKEREIAVLKRKLLKRHYRIRELQQKLSETVEGSSMQMYQ